MVHQNHVSLLGAVEENFLIIGINSIKDIFSVVIWGAGGGGASEGRGRGDVKQRLFQVQCSLDFNVELGQ